MARGKAWARQNSVLDAAGDYANTVSVQSPRDLADTYERRYLSDARTLVSRLKNRKEFSYDPGTDPVFQAYREQYRLEGSGPARGAMASYAALTGGYGNSAAATAGAQAGQYYTQQC